MEAVIRTNDMNLFNTLLQFLKTINVTIETAKEQSMMKSGCYSREFNALRLKTKGIKFNREEANER